jgi:lipopolysaccharide export system protein LptC
VLLFGIFSFWLLENLEKSEIAGHISAPHEPDYFIEDMVRRTTGEDGELRNILRSELVEHYPDDDSMELASPHLEIYNGNPEPWHVVAERGWVSSGNEVVLLHGAVEIWRNGANGERVYEVLTSELRVLPKEEYAETDNPAIIVGPATVTHAIGMRANFAHSRLELLKRVRSKYESKSQS